MHDEKSGPEKAYFEFLEGGHFMLQRSASSGRFVFYPRVAEPGTGASDLEWVVPSGLGTVYSSVTIRRKPPEPDFNASIIELDEGPRLLSRVEGIPPGEVRIGMRVRARIARTDGRAVLVFDPASEGSGR